MKTVVSQTCLRSILCVIAFLCFLTKAGAQTDGTTNYDFMVNGYYYRVTSETEKTVAITYERSSYDDYYDEAIFISGYTGSVSIPTSVTYNSQSYQVTSIDAHAFDGSSITAVSIPDCIREIGDGAFLDCRSLQSIILPQSVTSIGSGAFNGCMALTSINIPNGVTTINSSTFVYCQSLSSIIIPENVTSIGNYAFYGCLSLTSVTVKASTPVGIEYDTFSNRANATLYVPENSMEAYIASDYWNQFGTIVERPTLPENETYTINYDMMVDGCFYRVISNAERTVAITYEKASYDDYYDENIFISGYTGRVSIPTSFTYNSKDYQVTSIDAHAFDGSSITAVSIPDCIREIGDGAFLDCRSLQSVTLPQSVTSIGSGAFNGCMALTSINIPDGVTTINSSTFSNCQSLSSIIIPENVTSIGDYAFYGCTKMTSVTVDSPTPVAITSTTFSNRANSTLYVPTDSKTAYEAANYWKEFKEIRTPLTNGDTFTATTVEGVVVTYQITNSDLRECQVGYTYEKKKGTRVAIDKSTSGEITIPDVVNGYTVKKIGDYAFYECKNLTKVNLPSSVKSFGKNAFYDCINLEPFELPSDLTYISEGMFTGCKLFVNITLPSTVTSIGSYAFNGCTNLESINTENVKSIGSYAFYGCSKLTSICIPVGTTSISQGAFEKCSSLSAINIPEGVTSIGINAFTGCRSLKEITIPGTVHNMETWDNCWAFSGCSGLQTIILKKGVSVLGNNTFASCYNVERVIVENMNPISVHTSFDDFYTKATLYVPNGAKAAYLADSYWSKFKTIVELKPVTFADANVKDRCVSQWDTNGDSEIDYLEAVSIKSLKGAFKNTEITLFNELKYFTGITEIQSNEFFGCENLTSITIPNNVATIGDNAFSGCNKLTSVTVENFTPCELYQNPFPNRANATLYVPIGCKTAYEAADYWKEFKSIVEVDAASTYIAFADPSVKEICIAKTNWDSNGDGELSVAEAAAVTDLGEAFRYTSITSFNELRFFTGLKVIGENTFSGCKIEALSLPTSIEEIGDYAFSSCSSLLSVSLPDGLTTIGNSAFSYCTKLTNVIIPNSVTSIGSGAFSSCSGLSSIIIPSSVTSIGSGAFSYCGGLDSFVVEEGNEVYDSRDNCNALIETATNSLVRGTKNTIIPISVTSIGASAFSSLKELSDITIPNSIISIGNSAFYDCSGLTNISIPDGVVSIEAYTFYGCSSLTSISIPSSVTSIGESAFYGCRNLRTIFIPEGVTSINYYAFQYCKALESVSLPSSISSIQSGAFGDCEKLSSVTIYKEKPVYINYYSTFQYRSYATLYVPYGCKAAYEAASYWKEFKEIIELPVPAGTETTPFTCAEANAFVAGLTADTPTETEYYVKGKVSTIQYNFGYQYDNATFYISDDGTKNDEFYVYRTLYFDKQNYNGGRVPNLGDEVVLCGKLTYYNGTTPETVNKDCRLVSINGKTVGTGLELGDLFVAKTPENVEMFFVVDETGKSMGKANETGCSVGYAAANRPETYTNPPCCINANYDGVITIPATAEGFPIQVIAPSAFTNAKLISVIIPSTVLDIETNAFKDCQNLASVTLPEGVILNNGTFQNCTALTSIELPKNVQLWASEPVFGGCTNLATITVNDETPYYLQGSILVDDPSKVTLYVPAGSKAAYEAAEYWNEFKEIIEKEASKVKLSKTKAIIEKGKTLTLKAKVYPTTEDQSVTWKSSDKIIVTVTKAGKVKAVGVGTAKITCTSVATGAKATCKVTVGYVKLSKTEVTIEKGKTLTLKSKVYPTTEDQSVTWKSSDPTIVKVTSSGKIGGLKAGTATITCTSNATGLSATCEVTVGYVKLSASKLTIQKGEITKLKYKVYPMDLADQSVTWKSSDPTIVKVTTSGKIGGMKPGTATITCTSVATGLSATCTVTVTTPAGARSLGGDDGELTDIEDMEIQSVVIEPFDVYDLSGSKVRHQVTSLDGLPNGVYIVNGKKVLKK